MVKISGGAPHEPRIEVYWEMFTVQWLGFKSKLGRKTGVFMPNYPEVMYA